jgi:hypothetical protein
VLDLNQGSLQIDQVAGTWRNGDWYVQLVIQSTENAAEMRVCWNAQLEPTAPVQGPPDGGGPVVRTHPLKRLSCGLYGRYAATPAFGGYVVDDFGGNVTSFNGRW